MADADEHPSVRVAAKNAGLVKERWSVPAHDMAAMAVYLHARLTPAQRADLAARLAAQSAGRCATCGTTFTPLRANARYCSAACRQRAYRQRKGA
jgi:hypothetical protein